VVVADIPGLIEGASEGVGLGHDFLRHVERTRVLLHLVDISRPEESDPVSAWKIINEELRRYSQKLSEKPQILVLTKTDALPSEDYLAEMTQTFTSLGASPIFAISAVTHQGLQPLLNTMFETLDKLPEEEHVVELVPDAKAFTNDDSAFEISHEGKSIVVYGGKLDRLVRVTDFRNPSATRRLLNIFKAMGVYDEFEYHPDD
jgi:GTP-binding protein